MSRPTIARQLLGLLFLLLLGPAAAQACSPQDPSRVRDDPVTLYSDGSFTGASEDDRWYDLEGRPVRDIGGGRVGQVVERDDGCEGAFQELLVVDCTTGSAILVGGILNGPDDDVLFSARALQPPYGPLALTPSTTIAEVAALAAREGWSVVTDVPAFAAERGPQNAFNPFFGCRIFYPGSVGAGR